MEPRAATAMPPDPVRVSDQWPIVQNVTLVTSNDKGNNAIISGAVHRSPDIYLTAVLLWIYVVCSLLYV